MVRRRVGEAIQPEFGLESLTRIRATRSAGPFNCFRGT
jgi:hypothetical protein